MSNHQETIHLMTMDEILESIKNNPNSLNTGASSKDEEFSRFDEM